jgi:hypothetical protein
MFRIISLSSLMGSGGVSYFVSEMIVSISGRLFPLHQFMWKHVNFIQKPFQVQGCREQAMSSFLKKTLSIYFKMESPDDQAYFRQTRESNKAKTRRKTRFKLLCLEQASEINECLFSKNLKQPTRISPCSILDIFDQWSYHLEKNHTKLTNHRFKEFLVLTKKLSHFDQG